MHLRHIAESHRGTRSLEHNEQEGL